jgi:hypothetical protein
MKYESPITYHSKDMTKVKVFKKWVKLQGQGHKVKNHGTINRQTDGQAKNYMPPIFRYGGIKRTSL